MPLSVSCSCGKQFKVFDDLAGTDVRCQVCGKMCRVGAAESEPELDYAPNTPDDGSTKSCPACAEIIPKRSRTCPLCKEVLIGSPSKDGTILVSCVCGKQFKVFNDLAGTNVRCHGCQKMCRVGAAEPELDIDFDPNTPDDGSTKTCPACAEVIPKRARACPLCKEVLAVGSDRLSPAEREAVLAGVIEGIRQQPPTLDAELAGGFLSGKSIVLLVLCGLGLVSFIFGMATRGGEGFSVMGVIIGMIFTIPVIVSLVNDNKASHIQDAPTAQEALSRYLMAVKTGRTKKAYAALVPSSRTATTAETVRFKNPKIANQPKRMAFSDAAGFASYWKYNFTGPSLNTRNVAISKVRSVSKSGDGIEMCEATINTTSHSSLLFLLIFFNLIIAAVIIFAVQARDEAVIRKAVLKHNGRWYILDGAFQGELDRTI